MMKNTEVKYETFKPEGEEPNHEKGTVTIKPDYEKGTKISTRKAYGNGLLRARESNPNVVGLDGDTKNSTFAITLKDKYPESFV
jgi:transketolase